MNERPIRRLLRLPLFRARAEDTDDEIRFHLDTRAEQFMRRGMSRDEAIAEARRRFGITNDRDLDTIRAELRQSAARREQRMSIRDRIDTILRDTRYALRNIRSRPGFTAAVVLTLALGIGATTAIFSVVQAVILRPLPYAEPRHIAMVWTHWSNTTKSWLSQPEYYDYAAQSDVFEAFAAYTDGAVNLTSGDGGPERIGIGSATASLFDVTGVRPLLGRAFTKTEDVPGGPRVVLLGEDIWRRRFAADPGILGRTVQINGQSTEVIGIMPAAFRLPTQFAGERADAFVPLQLPPSNENDRGSHYLLGVGKLRRDVSVAQAQSRMNAFLVRFNRDNPNGYGPDFGVDVVSVSDEVRGNVRPVLFVLLGAVSFVLLIACANVANLLLSRAESRHREIAVRAALGASNGRIAGQLLTESVVLAIMGGVLGLALATAMTRALDRANLANLPRADMIGVDSLVLAFAAGVAIVTGLLFGLAPVTHMIRGDPQSMLKQGRGNTAGRSAFHLRAALVAAEIMLAVVATAGAVLMGRSFARLLSVHPGFATDHALSFRISAPPARYRSTSEIRRLMDNVLERVRAIPGVQQAGGVTALPLATELGDWGISIEGVPRTPPGKTAPAIDWMSATPGYLEAMRTPIVRGRTILATDRRDGQPVLVINEAAARKFFAGDAVGKRIMLAGTVDTVWRTVVGVAGDIRHAGLDKDVRPQMWIPYGQMMWTFPDSAGAVPRALSIVARTSGDPTAITAAARAAVRSVDPELPLAQVRTLDDVFARSVSTPRVVALLLGAFGGLALLLSAIGVYGVTAYGVARRTNEIGIRIALGAHVRDVIRLIVAQGMRPALVGVVLGVALAVAGTRLMQKFLFGVTPTDRVSLVAAPLALLLVGTAANWLPARRAARVDPVRALRLE